MIRYHPVGIPIEIGKEKPLTSLFHRLNSVIPDEQRLLTFTSTTLAADAIRIMRKQGFNQVPVVEGSEILGVFSFRSFARAVIDSSDERVPFGSLPVSEYLEQISFARVTDEFDSVIERIDRDDAVLVGDPKKLQAIVTAMDILRYLYDVASPYVMVAETELSIRALIAKCLDVGQLAVCVSNSLSAAYGPGKLPSRLEDLAFNDYVQVIGDGRNWPSFETTFGGTRLRTRAKLERMRDLRNDLFHFRRALTVEEYEELSTLRNWLLIRTRMLQARREGDQDAKRA